MNFKDGEISLTNGPIQAADLDVYLDEAVKYELEMSRPEANMFSINSSVTSVVEFCRRESTGSRF